MARGPLSPRSTSNSTLSPSLRASKSSCEGWCDGRRFFSILGMDEPEPSVVDDPLNCSLHVASIVVVRGFVGNDWERLGRMTHCRKSPFFPRVVRLRSGFVKNSLIYISSV